MCKEAGKNESVPESAASEQAYHDLKTVCAGEFSARGAFLNSEPELNCYRAKCASSNINFHL